MSELTFFLPFLFGGLFLGLVFVLLQSSRNKERDELIQSRLRALRNQGGQMNSAQDYSLFEADHEKLLQTKLDDFFKNLNKKRGVQTSFLQKLTAGISTGLAVLIILGTGVISTFILKVLMVLDWSDAVLFGIPAGLGLTVSILRKMQDRREKEFLAAFPIAFDIVARGLKAGGTIEKTFITVSEQVEGPVGLEFKRINQEIDFGVNFEEAMINAAERIQIDDFSFFTIALIIQRKAGGSLSELVSNISAFLRKRQELRLKVKALSAEATATGLIVGSLPLIMLVLMYFINPETIDTLRFDPAGRKLSLFLMVYMTIGIVIIRKMTNMKV